MSSPGFYGLLFTCTVILSLFMKRLDIEILQEPYRWIVIFFLLLVCCLILYLSNRSASKFVSNLKQSVKKGFWISPTVFDKAMSSVLCVTFLISFLLCGFYMGFKYDLLSATELVIVGLFFFAFFIAFIIAILGTFLEVFISGQEIVLKMPLLHKKYSMEKIDSVQVGPFALFIFFKDKHWALFPIPCFNEYYRKIIDEVTQLHLRHKGP